MSTNQQHRVLRGSECTVRTRGKAGWPGPQGCSSLSGKRKLWTPREAAIWHRVLLWTEGEVTLGYSVTLALAIAPRQPNVPLPGHSAAKTRARIELYMLFRFILVCLFACFIEWRGEKAFKLFFFLLYAVHLSSWRWPTKY